MWRLFSLSVRKDLTNTLSVVVDEDLLVVLVHELLEVVSTAWELHALLVVVVELGSDGRDLPGPE